MMVVTSTSEAGSAVGRSSGRRNMTAMKKRETSARSPNKLGINKEKLQALSQDELHNVNGGGDPPGRPHKADGSAFQYC